MTEEELPHKRIVVDETKWKKFDIKDMREAASKKLEKAQRKYDNEKNKS